MTMHGGDVWQVAEEQGIHVTDLLDFSANVNPRGLPRRAIDRLAKDAANAPLLKLYPDPSARELRRTLSARLGVPPDAIVVGPGAEALLAPALRSTDARSALVPVPAFSEYRRICAQLSVDFIPWSLDRSADFRLSAGKLCRNLHSAEALILNNPHNPSGVLMDVLDVRRVVDAADAAGVAVILDEAFIDYAPDHSMAREAARRPGLIVVRSLTKFYGCPALRVGYAVSHPDTIASIRSSLPTWPVAQLAMDVLTEALQDADYAGETLHENEVERSWLADALTALGLVVLPSATNYLLAELGPSMPPSAQLRLQLARRHNILIRNCDSFEELATGRWIRLAVRSRPDNMRLVSALKEELGAP